MVVGGVLAVSGGVVNVAAAGALAYADAGAFVLCSSLHTCQAAAVAGGGGVLFWCCVVLLLDASVSSICVQAGTLACVVLCCIVVMG
jgi:hypothetical protein